MENTKLQIIESPKPNYKENLLSLTTQLTNLPLSSVISQPENLQEQKITLFQAENCLSIQDCITSTPLFLTKKGIGSTQTLKIVSFIIWNFQSSLKLSNDRILDSAEIVILAKEYIEKYSHDSIADLIFALKKAKHDATVFYNKFSFQDFYSIVNKHFEQKSIELEADNKKIETPISNQIANLIEASSAKFLGNGMIEPYKVSESRKLALKQIQNYESQISENEEAA